MGLTFASVIIAAALGLGAWEVSVYRRGEDAWLATPKRFRRRMMISIILLAVGALMLVEALGFLPERSAKGLLLWLTGLFGLSIILIVLAGLDVSDTTRAASRRDLIELEQAIEEYRADVAKESPTDDQP